MPLFHNPELEIEVEYTEQQVAAGEVPGHYVPLDASGKPQPTAAMHESQLFLNKTDWYVVRKLETGKEIPEEILRAREQARASINL